jgi:hypothetical protein
VAAQSKTKPGPERIFEMMFAHQRAAALKAVIELDLFTAIGEGVDTVSALASRNAGISTNELRPLAGSGHSLILSRV